MSNNKEKRVKESNNIFQKKWYTTIKSNLAIILLIPTLVGGIWQISSLLSLGFEYARFFSVTQLVADGLIMMILIPFTAILPMVSYLFFWAIRTGFFKKRSSLLREVIYYLLLSGLLLWFCYTCLDYYIISLDDKPDLFIISLAFLLFVPFIESYYIVGGKLNKRLNTYTRLCERRYKLMKQRLYVRLMMALNVTLGIFWGLTLALSIVFSFGAFLGIANSLGTYFISDNLLNVKNVEKVINNQYGLSPEEYDIKYFNDSYIFIEHITVSGLGEPGSELEMENVSISTEIIILKFDTLFEAE